MADLANEIATNAARIIQAATTSCSFTVPATYPATCEPVPPLLERSCKLLLPASLPASLAGLYLIDPGLTNIYAIEASLLMGVRACCLWKNEGLTPVATVTGMSSRRFSETRPDTPTSQHNFGRAFDVKLAGLMKSNGASYDKKKCALLCLCCALAGASFVIFSDQEVVDAVNKILRNNLKPQVCRNLPDHENHVHMDNR
jgi:hypothetical protein